MDLDSISMKLSLILMIPPTGPCPSPPDGDV